MTPGFFLLLMKFSWPPFPVTEALVRMPRVLQRLHALPRFSKALNYVTMHNEFIWRFQAANLLPKGETEEIFTRYEQLAAVYPVAIRIWCRVTTT